MTGSGSLGVGRFVGWFIRSLMCVCALPFQLAVHAFMFRVMRMLAYSSLVCLVAWPACKQGATEPSKRVVCVSAFRPNCTSARPPGFRAVRWSVLVSVCPYIFVLFALFAVFVFVFTCSLFVCGPLFITVGLFFRDGWWVEGWAGKVSGWLV